MHSVTLKVSKIPSPPKGQTTKSYTKARAHYGEQYKPKVGAIKNVEVSEKGMFIPGLTSGIPAHVPFVRPNTAGKRDKAPDYSAGPAVATDAQPLVEEEAAAEVVAEIVAPAAEEEVVAEIVAPAEEEVVAEIVAPATEEEVVAETVEPAAEEEVVAEIVEPAAEEDVVAEVEEEAEVEVEIEAEVKATVEEGTYVESQEELHEHASTWAVEVFQAADKNQDGTLTKSEIKNYFKSHPEDKEALLGKDFHWHAFWGEMDEDGALLSGFRSKNLG
jgi:hypothetical protein